VPYAIGAASRNLGFVPLSLRQRSVAASADTAAPAAAEESRIPATKRTTLEASSGGPTYLGPKWRRSTTEPPWNLPPAKHVEHQARHLLVNL
jgi:hypothetical protein